MYRKILLENNSFNRKGVALLEWIKALLSNKQYRVKSETGQSYYRAKLRKPHDSYGFLH